MHIACLALGIGPGDQVWTTPNTFVASANCARYCGAGVDFVDIDPETCNMSVPSLEAKLAEAKRSGRLPKAVIPVHFSGQPADMEEIAALGRRYGFRIIEDASHAVGATYRDTTVGDCRHSDIAVFSFHPVKIITSGEGGMALTNRKALADRMELLRSHGITRDESLFSFDKPGPWYYEQIALGFNYRMIELEAALGLSQLSRLDAFVERRNEIAAAYDRELADLPDCPTLSSARTAGPAFISMWCACRTRTPCATAWYSRPCAQQASASISTISLYTFSPISVRSALGPACFRLPRPMPTRPFRCQFFLI